MENPFNSQVSLLQASCGTEIGLLPWAANPCVFITCFSEWEGFIHISLCFFFITPQPRRPNCKGQRENRDRFCTTPEDKERSSVAVGGESRQTGKNAIVLFKSVSRISLA